MNTSGHEKEVIHDTKRDGSFVTKKKTGAPHELQVQGEQWRSKLKGKLIFLFFFFFLNYPKPQTQINGF